MLISKSGAQSATIVGRAELQPALINTLSAADDRPEVLAALKVCIAGLQKP